MSDTREPSAAYKRVQDDWLRKVEAMSKLGFHVEASLKMGPEQPVAPNPWRRKKRPRFEDRAALVRFHANKRRAAKLKRTPPWADLEAMCSIYAKAQRLTVETGIPHHVDHVIPLQGKLVSGLHVANNLQILTGSENSRKRNHFEIEA